MSEQTFLPRPIDGFSYVQNIWPLLYHQPAHALAQMDAWRRAKGYRLRYATGPDESQQAMPARGDVEYQIKLKPGSWWYGYSTAQSAPLFDIRLTDQATGCLIFSDFVDSSQLYADLVYGGAVAPNPGGPMLLPQPYPITEPGLLNLEVHNHDTIARTFQLVLCLMEPCVRIARRQACVG